MRSMEYYRRADLVVVFEHHHRDLINPPSDSLKFQYLSKIDFDHGLRLMFPQLCRTTPASKLDVMIHDLLGVTRERKLAEMQTLIHDLVQVKRVGSIFITD